MLKSVLPFSPDLTERVLEYCEKHAEVIAQSNTVQYGDSAKRRHAIHLALPTLLHIHWEWTIRHYIDTEMMSSRLQGQWIIWMAQWIAPKRGFSAVAWYEGTRNSKAEIVGLDIRSEVLETTSNFFTEFGVADRITLVEGPAAKSSVQRSKDLFSIRYLQHGFFRVRTIEGEFDLIFFDPDKQNNKLYLDLVLEQRLLSPEGVILVDNGQSLFDVPRWYLFLAERRRPFWETAGGTLGKVNQEDFGEDPRVDTLMLPLFDGMTKIKRKEGFPARCESSS
ncbi:MAG: hypothetical protein Q9210_001765 [Variospora velana]